MKDAETKARRKLAAAIQTKVIGAGVVCLLRTDEGKAVAIAANDVELIGVYCEGVTVDWIDEDLTEAEVRT